MHDKPVLVLSLTAEHPGNGAGPIVFNRCFRFQQACGLSFSQAQEDGDAVERGAGPARLGIPRAGAVICT